MQKEIEGLEDTSQQAFFKEELAEKVFTSLDEDSINFIKKHEEIYKADYQSNSYREKIGLCLDDLIDEDEYQISPKRLILFEEGLTHLKLLLSISSDIEIKSFYKKIQNEKILDPDNPEHTAILEVLNLHLYKPRKKKLNPSFKIKLDFLLYLKQITTDSMKENYQILTDAKKEYRLYLDKVRSSSIQFKNKLKEKYAVENEVLKVNEENKKMETLKRSLSIGKKKLKYLKKRIDLYAEYINIEQKEKVKEEFYKKEAPLPNVEKEQLKYKKLLECFKDQKLEVKSVWKEIQKFSTDRCEVHKKYSNISEALSQLEHRLEKDIAYKDNLVKEIKSLGSYAQHIDLEQKETSKVDNVKAKSSVANIEQEKVKYRKLLKIFHEQKIELKDISSEVQKLSNKRDEVFKKYSGISEDLLKIEHVLKRETIYKDSLAKNIKSLTGKIKNQQSELQYLKNILDSYYSLESCFLIESDKTKMSLEVQGKIFNRHCNGGKNIHHNFDFNENRYNEDFSEINLEAENLCNGLNIIHKKNQKILERANSLEKKISKEKKRFSDFKNEFSGQMLPKHTVKLRKKISKNGKLLGKVKLDFDKLGDSLAEIKKEKEVGLFSLKENGKEYLSLTGKWRIFIELLKEKVLDNENLLMGLYEKLSGVRIELASIYEMFEISYLCDDQFLKTVNNTHETIEGLRKDILREIQSARESLENEERNISSHIKKQRRTEEIYKEFCCKFQGSYLNRADIEVLLYQNSDLEKKLNDLYPEEALKNNGGKLASKYLDSTEYIKESLKNALNTILSWNKWSYIFPRLVRVEAFPLLRAGVAVFLLLSVFSYLLVYKANSGNMYDYEKGLLALNLSEEKNENGKLDDEIKNMANASEYQKKIDQFNGNTAEELHSVGKINTLQSNSLNIIPSSLLPESDEGIIGDNSEDMAEMNPLWVNYSDIFDDLRFDNPSSAFRLFEIMMNRQTIDLTLMDSIQLLYSIRKVLRTEEGPFFDRLFNDFIKLGIEKKKAASSILHNDKIIEKKYGTDVHYLFKGKLKPIAMLEEMEMKDFEKILVPYIISNYKSFARFKKISVPENVNAYAINLAQDIYICAKKFRVPVTSLLTIVHQESFFINLLGDKGKSASPFQIYQPTKKLILNDMKQDGFKLPENVPNLENHVTFAAYMAAYHFAHLVKSYARPIIDPILHKPTALIVNLSKSTKFYNGGKYYDKKVMLKQKKLERYLKDKMRKTPLAS